MHLKLIILILQSCRSRNVARTLGGHLWSFDDPLRHQHCIWSRSGPLIRHLEWSLWYFRAGRGLSCWHWYHFWWLLGSMVSSWHWLSFIINYLAILMKLACDLTYKFNSNNPRTFADVFIVLLGPLCVTMSMILELTWIDQNGAPPQPSHYVWWESRPKAAFNHMLK